MTSQVKTNFPQQIELRGYERVVTMADNLSLKIVHSMLVAGDTETLVRFLPVALARTFNMHPRMRAMQTKGKPFMAEIHEPVPVDDISNKNLLRIRRFSPSEVFESWEQYAEDECNVAIDRYTQFPFFLTVWICEQNEQTRLMLFSDHYMSDGYSGMIVLNCILEQVALLSKQGDLEMKEVIEYPLRISLYENSLSDLWISKHLLKIGITLSGKRIYRQIVQKFKPVLPTRSDQHDFIMPPVQNPTSASFAMGSPSCMTKALARCKSEHVTFAGALTSAVVAAFYHTATSQRDFDPEKPFKLMVDMDYNMRQRVPHPAEEDHVGAFIAFAGLDWLLEEGVDMKTTSFWDLARRAKEEIDSNLHHKRMMAAVSMTVDQITNAKMDPSFANKLRIENSVDSDGNISNVGRYPFSRNFSLGKQDKALTVKSLHVYNPLPHLGPSAIFYVSSVESFCYSMGHKCEDATASTLFHTWVKICESIGEIGVSTTVVEILRSVASSNM